MPTLRLTAEARKDLREATEYYEAVRVGLGDEFLAETVRVFDLIVDRPGLLPIVYKDTRRALVRRFPYGVFLREVGSVRRVIAVMDPRRHPRRWQRRA